jgi:hypothetical protein
MAKLSIIPAPVFTAPVPTPVPGGESDMVAVTFKHRTNAELNEFLAFVHGKPPAEAIPLFVIGWDFHEEFTPENVAVLVQNRPGFGNEALDVYVAELTKYRQKN